MEEYIVRVVDLKKWFPLSKDFLGKFLSGKENHVRAVDGISFNIRKGETLGLAGESGCGKTTIGNLTLRLMEPTSGKIYFEDCDISSINKKDMKILRRKMQIVYQNPYESLDPRQIIYESIKEPLTINRLVSDEDEKKEIVCKILEDMDLMPVEDFLYRLPHELSGGQRQRVAIARILVIKPKFIVLDEPVSMVDISVRSGILDKLIELQKTFDLTYLFISHDLAVSRYICNNIAIMYLGKIMEMGSTESIIGNPLHYYTRALISACPVPDPMKRNYNVEIKGIIGSSINPPIGCRFNPRCLYSTDICYKQEPELLEIKKGHYVACHHTKE